MIPARRLPRPAIPLLVLLLAGAAGVLVRAQLMPGDRGVPVLDSSSSYEVTGVTVDTEAKTADLARSSGWREAQRKGWKMLWGRVNGLPPAQAPGLPDSTLDSIVAGIVVEDEQIGPRRYIARLGVLFDRARAGGLLGVQGQAVRSAPMLMIPVLWQGGAPVSFELRNEWQKAWARFRPGGSPIDYVRVAGTGGDVLLLNAAQTGRPGRTWWRMLLDQYGAADIVIPVAQLTRAWPGGPVIGHFVARHGPDNGVIEDFTLRADSAEAMPQMLDAAVRRIDEAYARALQDGRLTPDPSLLDQAAAQEEAPAAESGDEAQTEEVAGAATISAYSVQADTPDAAALGAAENALRSVPGVRGVQTISLALGGTSVLRVGYDGDIEALRLALAARGWPADGPGGTMRIRRIGPPPAPRASPPPPPPPAP